MDDTVVCPGCQTRLMLPIALEQQTVQCPRCRHVFGSLQSAHMAAPTMRPMRSRADAADRLDDEWDGAPTTRFVPAEPPRGRWTATAAISLLALSVLCFAFQGYVDYERIDPVEKAIARNVDIANFQGPVGFNFRGGIVALPRIPAPDLQSRWEALDRLQRYASIALHATFWPAMVFFLLWFQRAAANLRNLHVEGRSYTGVVPAATFFIPFLNFYRPYLIMQEIWRASHPRAIRSWLQSPKSNTIRLWWLACWLVVVASAVMQATDSRFMEGYLIGQRWACVQAFFAVIAGTTLFFIIRRIVQRQEDRYQRLSEEVD